MLLALCCKNECHKGVPAGQGACCQIKSQHRSAPAAEIRPSCSHTGRFIALSVEVVLQRPGESQAEALWEIYPFSLILKNLKKKVLYGIMCLEKCCFLSGRKCNNYSDIQFSQFLFSNCTLRVSLRTFL